MSEDYYYQNPVFYGVAGQKLAPSKAKVDARSELLSDASEIITSDRNKQYGEPEDNFRRIAELWEVYLGEKSNAHPELKPHDVAAMMTLLKIARIMHDPSNRDSWLDAAGYLACGWASVTS